MIFVSGLLAVIMAPLTVYNILIVLVYATLFWYLYKEDQNTRVIELQRPTDNEEVIINIVKHSALINVINILIQDLIDFFLTGSTN